jgi:ElaB/YqjD/DUF883 family membrane-anchored ribosome-binding protein
MGMFSKDREPQAAEQLTALISDAEQLLASLGVDSDAAVAALRQRVERTLHSARDTLGNLRSTAANATQQAKEQADSYVQSNPWTAVALAAAAGALVGAMAARRI